MRLARKKQHENEIVHKTKRAFLLWKIVTDWTHLKNRMKTFSVRCARFTKTATCVCSQFWRVLSKNCGVCLLKIVARAF